MGDRGFHWPPLLPADDEPPSTGFVKLWPHYFTMACLVVYSAPTVAAIRLASEPNVQHWVGRWGYGAILVPVVLCACHAEHLKHATPKVAPVLVSVFVPAVALLVLANIHLSSTNIVAHMLVSKDCMTYATKSDMQRSWVLAARLYEQCVNRTAAEHGFRYEDGLGALRVHDCAEYAERDPDPWAEHREKWGYLRRMEEEHECSGWCWHTPALWTYQDVKDSCSITAGEVLLAKVKPVSLFVLAISVLALAFALAVTVALCCKGDIDWASHF